MITEALLCGIDDWIDLMGDPLLSGSIFMVSYGITALLILRVAGQAETREHWYWRACGFLFIFQLFNTHLDLHALIWTGGRCLAHAQGWYDSRREVQFYFLVALAVLGLLVLAVVFVYFLRNIIGNLLLTAGVGLALGFTIIKGVNYHHLEQIYSGRLGPFYYADYIEFSGIAIAFCAALFRLNQLRLEPP